MSHPNETVLRDAYAAFAKDDIPGFLAHCAPGLIFRMPGQGLLAGHHTVEGFFAKLGPAMQAVRGTFREEVLHVLAGDEQGVVVVAQSAERDGTLYKWNCSHWWRIEKGRLAEFWEFVDDPAAYESAWRA